MKWFLILYIVVVSSNSFAVEEEVDCLKNSETILDISELSETVQKIKCGSTPIVTTTAIHKKAFEKAANVAMNLASNKINDELTAKTFNFPSKEIILPSPEVMRALFPLVKMVPEIGNMYLTDRIKNMGAKEFINICRNDLKLCTAMMIFNLHQKLKSEKTGEPMQYNKMIEYYQNNIVKFADEIGQSIANIELALRRAAVTVYNGYKYMNNGFKETDVFGNNIFTDLPTGTGPIGEQIKSVMEHVRLHPYQADLQNSRLNYIRFGKIYIKEMSENTYSFSTCLVFGVEGTIKLTEKEDRKRDVFNSKVNVSSSNCKAWAAIVATSYITPDGRVNFKINIDSSRIYIPNDSLNINLKNSNADGLLNQELNIFAEEVKKNLFNKQNFKIISDMLSKYVSEKIMPKLNQALQTAQKKNFSFKHALTPITTQSVIAESMYNEFKKQIDLTSPENIQDLIQKSDSILSDYSKIAKNNPEIAFKISEYSQRVKKDLEDVYQKIKDRPENQTGSLINPLNLIKYTFTNNDAEKVSSLIDQSNGLINKTKKIGSKALEKDYSKTEVRIFVNPKVKDYLYYATITCPNQASLIDNKDKKIEFFKPEIKNKKPDFVVNISENSINEYLTELYKHNLLDINISKNGDLEKINFTNKAPQVTLGADGRFKINFSAKMNLKNVPSNITDDVHVDADLKFSVSPDGKKLVITQENLKYYLGVNQKTINLGKVLETLSFKLPLNILIPIIGPVANSVDHEVVNQNIPEKITEKVTNLKAGTYNGHIVITGNFK